MRAALAQAAPDQLTAAGRRAISAVLQKAQTKVNAAAKTTSGKRGARLRRNAQAALRAVAKAIKTAGKRGQVKGPLAGSLLGEANGALESARALGVSS